MANEITPGLNSFCFNRIYILLSSSIPMTFYDFFHDLFKFSMTLRLAVTFKKLFVALEYFLTFNSSTDTNSGVHKNACCSHCLIPTLYLTLSPPVM